MKNINTFLAALDKVENCCEIDVVQVYRTWLGSRRFFGRRGRDSGMRRNVTKILIR